jgi:hypothetical protein
MQSLYKRRMAAINKNYWSSVEKLKKEIEIVDKLKNYLQEERDNPWSPISSWKKYNFGNYYDIFLPEKDFIKHVHIYFDEICDLLDIYAEIAREYLEENSISFALDTSNQYFHFEFRTKTGKNFCEPIYQDEEELTSKKLIGYKCY